MFLQVVRAESVGDHRLRVWFNDSFEGVVDFREVLDGPIFAPLKDPAFFARYRIEGHTLAWENGADFAPEYLRQLAKPISAPVSVEPIVASAMEVTSP